MALQILESKGIFEVEGDLTGKNLKLAKIHFNYLIDYCEGVITISFQKVKKIDKSTLSAMTELYEKAKRQGKTLLIYGARKMNVNTYLRKGKLYFAFNNDCIAA